MKLKLLLIDQLKGTVPDELLDQLPSGFQRIGDLLLVRIASELSEWEEDIGRVLKEQFRARAVFSRGPVQGVLRKPQVKLIAGRGTTTIHKENGCQFKIDVTKAMFAKGNMVERSRIQPTDEEEVVDMFAGIGYFTIPLARLHPTVQVLAIEKNPEAVTLLKENILLNKLRNVTVEEADCREVETKADRVLMGYYPGTEAFLPTAFSFFRREGILHYHNVHRRGDLWRLPLGTLETQALHHGYLTTVLLKRIVKTVSPCKVHVVVDLQLRKH